MHEIDAISVANRLAHHGKASCILIPTDFTGLLQGLVGRWWECGYGSRYETEAHAVATSTVVLARKSLCAAWADVTRIRIADAAVGPRRFRQPVCSYDMPVADAESVVMTFAHIIFLDFPNWCVARPLCFFPPFLSECGAGPACHRLHLHRLFLPPAYLLSLACGVVGLAQSGVGLTHSGVRLNLCSARA